MSFLPLTSMILAFFTSGVPYLKKSECDLLEQQPLESMDIDLSQAQTGARK